MNPALYQHAQPRLFNDDSLFKYSIMQYNSSENSGFAVGSNKYDGGSGTYYNYGITAAYNGDGYDTFYTFKSLSQTE
ncbi:MAG: hypothetical protein AB7V48_10180 [Sedimentibacter sp.]